MSNLKESRKSKEGIWNFPSSIGGMQESVNNAAMENFKGNRISSLARETCQNSLDARLDQTEPVTVEFDLYSVQKNEINDISALESAIDSIEHHWNHSENAQINEFIEDAKNAFGKDEIPFMRISDYNTTGLSGADSAKPGTPWSSLIKEKGSSNKSDNSGGSFGIGKAAPLACSTFRTLFYSTLDENNKTYHIGVAHLLSFEKEDGEITQGPAFYSADKHSNAIEAQLPFANFERKSNGTDVYIMGFNQSNKWEDKLIESVISNFLVSIWKGYLEVKLENHVVNKETLESHVEDLDSKKFKDLKNYYKLLTVDDKDVIEIKSEDYGKQYDFEDSEAKLLLMHEPENYDLNRKILITRKMGMTLFEQDRISGAIPFTGILMIEGKNMNPEFKRMENPAHDKFLPDRVEKNKKKYRNMWNDLKRYMKEKVLELYQGDIEDEVNVSLVSDFLPSTHQLNNGDKNKQDSLDIDVTKINLKKRDNKKPDTIEVEKDYDDIVKEVGSTYGELDEGNQGGGSKATDESDGDKYGGQGNQDGNSGAEDDAESSIGSHTMDKKVTNDITIKTLSNQDVTTTLFLKPHKNMENVDIEIFISTERNELKEELKNVTSDELKNLNFKNNKIDIGNIEKDKLYKLNLEFFDFTQASLGVKVYESKK